MTLSTVSARVSHAGNASTTAFAVPYYFLSDGDLAVYLTNDGVDTLLTLTTHYTVTGAGDEAGGTVTMVAAPAVGETLTIIREPEQTQGTDYQANDPFPAETHERALDKGMMVSQHLQDQIDHTLRFPVSSTGVDGTLTSLEAGRYIVVNDAGDGFKMGPSVNSTDDPGDAVLPVKFYASETILAADVENLDDGQICDVSGNRFEVDSTVLLENSALRDYGVAGVKAQGIPHNMYLGAFFKGRPTRETADIVLTTSPDGLNFSPVILHPLATPSGNGKVNGRDPSLLLYRGMWYMFCTGSEEGTRDFTMWDSPDGLTWRRQDGKLGATIKTSDSVALPGGSVPASYIWGPEVVIDVDGQLYIILSVTYDNDLTDDYANTINNFRPFYSTLSLPDFTVGEPVSLDMGGAEATVSYIGHAFKVIDGVLWMAVKNDVTKLMEIWKSDGGMAGTFTKQWTSDAEISQEGYAWTDHISREDNGDLSTSYEIFIDQNRQGPDQFEPDEFAEIPWKITSDTPGADWASPVRFYTGHATRHGTVLNLGRGTSPKFIKDLERMRAIYASDPRANVTFAQELPDGEKVIFPREGVAYFVDGNDTHCELTIGQGNADSFWLGVFAGNKSTGITVVEDDTNSQVAGGPFYYGFGLRQAKLTRFVRREDNQYYPEASDAAPPIKIRMGSAQTVTGDVETVVDFDTVTFDAADTYDTSTKRWTPAAGFVRLDAHVTIPAAASEDGENCVISIRKNGSAIKTTTLPGIAKKMTLTASISSLADGDDYYDVTVKLEGTSASRTLSAVNAETMFEGFYL